MQGCADTAAFRLAYLRGDLGMCGLPARHSGRSTGTAARGWGGTAVSTTVDQAGGRGLAERLGITPGMVVQELGYDDDVDTELRDAIVERCGNELVDEEADDVVDFVLLSWLEDDGD